MVIEYRWIGENEIYIIAATSAGFASLASDPMIEIISINGVAY
jgi:hypothetical protein